MQKKTAFKRSSLQMNLMKHRNNRKTIAINIFKSPKSWTQSQHNNIGNNVDKQIPIYKCNRNLYTSYQITKICGSIASNFIKEDIEIMCQNSMILSRLVIHRDVAYG